MPTHDGSPMIGDIDDLQQVDENEPIVIPPIPVIVEGPLQTHQVPSISGGSRSYSLLTADRSRRVGNADPRRRSLTIVGEVAFYVGETANEVESRYSAKWPANQPCRITHSEEVYVSPAADGIVSVMTENWAN